MRELETPPLDAELADLVARFHREQQGHRPSFSEAHLLSNMAVVRTTGIFTPTEETLCGSTDGRKLIQSARREQRALTRRDIEGRVAKLLNRQVSRSYYDLDVRTGEQVEVYILD